MKLAIPRAGCVILWACCGALLASNASAAIYEVTSCKELERETLPTRDWTYEPRGADFETLTNCETQPVALRTRFGANTLPGQGAGITFTAPAPLSIVGLQHRMLIKAPRSIDPGRPWWWDFDTSVTDLD